MKDNDGFRYNRVISDEGFERIDKPLEKARKEEKNGNCKTCRYYKLELVGTSVTNVVETCLRSALNEPYGVQELIDERRWCEYYGEDDERNNSEKKN